MVLILIGLLNYLNVIATGILSRKRELAVYVSVLLVMYGLMEKRSVTQRTAEE